MLSGLRSCSSVIGAACHGCTVGRTGALNSILERRTALHLIAVVRLCRGPSRARRRRRRRSDRRHRPPPRRWSLTLKLSPSSLYTAMPSATP